MPLNQATGAFTYTNPTGATGASPGTVIASAVWNQTFNDLSAATTQIYEQYLAGQSVGNNILWGNGGFEVWQRGAGNSSTIVVNSSPTTGTYTADRWYLSTQVSVTCSVSAVAGIDTPNNSALACRITRNSGTTSGAAIFAYPLDTDGCYALRGQKVSLSFWASTGANWSGGTLTAVLYTGTGTPVKQVVGYSNIAVMFEASVAIAPGSSPTLYNVSNMTSIVNSVGAVNISQAELQFFIFFTGAPGAADSLTIDDVQLEVQGSAAAPYNSPYVGGAYDHVPFSLMLMDCRQHYQETFPYNTAPGQSVPGGYGAITAIGQVANTRVGQMYMFDPPMRNTPLITTYAPSAASSNWLDFTAGTTMAATVTVSSSIGVLVYTSASVPTAGDIIGIHLTADAGI